MSEAVTQKQEKKRFLFISAEDTGLDLMVPTIGRDGQVFKEKHRLRFENAILVITDEYFDNPEAVAEAIRKHPHFGWRFWEDKGGRTVINKFNPDKKPLADALGAMSLNILRAIAKEKKMMDGDWSKISQSGKEDLVEYMVNHRDKLGEYESLGA